MEILLSVGIFIKVFVLMMSILYCLKIVYEILKVYTLQEGKVELGKNGLTYLACAIAYILTYLIA